MRRRGLAGWGVGLLIGLALLARSVTAQTGLTRGPYLQSTTRDSTIVVWQTGSAGDSVVEYGTAGFTSAITDTTLASTHVVTLTGLSTGATYQYRVKTGGTLLYTSTFATAPNAGAAFDFVIIGDSGTNSPEQNAVAARMNALQPDFILHTGDVIYPSGAAGDYDSKFFQPYRDLLDDAPIFPSLGNHDYGTASGGPYLDVFYLPANAPANLERYYSFDWGNAHFVALDSMRLYPNTAMTDTVMLDWLQADLAASTATWKFVYFHHAPYTSGAHRNDAYVLPVRNTLGPIFAQREVDVVFTGHDHSYERSRPISGTVYIVSGGGGAPLYAVVPQLFTAYAASVHHTVQVQIEGCVLSLRAIDASGAVFDQIALSKCPNHIYLPVILKSSWATLRHGLPTHNF
jgi:predicted phosphodiesterase